MALCESQLDCVLPQQLKREQSPGDERGKQRADDKQSQLHHNGDIYALNQVPGGLPLSVDYRSPVSHFVPPAVELYAARQKQEQSSAAESSQPVTPVKRKRGRPRIDKTSPEYLASLAARKQAREMAHSSVSSDRVRVSHQATPGKRNRGRPRIDKTDPEYLANLAARKQARDIAAMMNNSRTPESGEKRKRGRPRVDKTSPEYLARKRARELEALERKAKREYKRRATGAKPIAKTQLPTRVMKKLPAAVKNKMVARKMPSKVGNTVRKVGDRKVLLRRNTKLIRRKGLRSTDSAASSSAGESTPRTKRKYTKRTPNTKKDATGSTERIKGKRGRPRKVDQITANKQLQQPKIRVRNNLMPVNTEPISLDSDDEPDLGSPSQASDSLSLDENLRAIRHIHEKYANIDKDDRYEAHLLAANFKKPTLEPQRRDDEDVLSVRSSEGCGSVKDAETKIEKLEDSSNSDSDSSSSGSGSSSSGSSTSSSSDSSSSDSSDSESDSEVDKPKTELPPQAHADNTTADDDRSFGAWSYSGAASGSDSEPDPEREAGAAGPPPPGSHDEISESENESADKSFQCHICSKWYSTRVTLKIHRRVHLNRGGGARRSRARSGDRYECDCCSMTFNRREKLWEHRAEVHRGAMTVRCDVCKKCFEDDAELAAHAGGHTDDERAGRCSWCGASFPRWEQLRRHRAVAHGAGGAGAAGAGAGGGGAGAGGGGAPHACAVCGKRFGHAHSLTRHMHNHAKQLYRCVVCKASFDRADQLANHLNSHLANYKRLKP